ncbi:Desert hedgehog protein [Galdieria sulphuraria]|nr:Desert hedgehog protein [Galdieria sulphuraria]
MDISKFLSLFDMSIQEFVKQTGASIEDILNWFNITFETFVNETNLALDEILKIFNVGLHDVFEIASMSVQDFIDFFGYSMKTFVQSFGLGINDVLNVFGIGFADFIKLMQYSITELFSIFDNFFDDISDLVQWLFDNLSKDVCEVIHILCPSLFSCFGLGSLCDLRRTAIPFNDIRQQTGNLYVSVSSSSQGSCSQKNSGSQSSTSSSSGGGSGVSCFSGNSRVHLDSFHTKSMEQLQVGDIILDAKGKPTQVIGWLHRDEYQEANFAHVHFTNMSNTLIISGEHLVFSSNGAIQSKTIVPGNTLLKTNTGVITVQSVKWFTSKGVYAPLTSSGTLLVNGIACSCYAYFPSHRVANLFVPMIWKLLRPFHNYHDILSLAPFVIQRWTRHFK